MSVANAERGTSEGMPYARCLIGLRLRSLREPPLDVAGEASLSRAYEGFGLGESVRTARGIKARPRRSEV
jgi:hypothetical protein